MLGRRRRRRRRRRRWWWWWRWRRLVVALHVEKEGGGGLGLQLGNSAINGRLMLLPPMMLQMMIRVQL
jgi:hypothetical protein